MPKFGERVFAVMRRRIVDGKPRLFRRQTKIYFNDEARLLGTVFMTNPGSYRMNKHPDWSDFHQGLGTIEEISGYSTPDPTMQNIISTVRHAYLEAGLTTRGYVSIFNLSTLVEADGAQIARLHGETGKALGEEFASLIREAECYESDAFHRQCAESKFIMLGFLRNVFPSELKRMTEWTAVHSAKLVYSSDKNGNFIHPYRWRLLPAAKEEIRNRLLQIL